MHIDDVLGLELTEGRHVPTALADGALRARMTTIAAEVGTPGTVRAADLIEQLARSSAPVSR